MSAPWTLWVGAGAAAAAVGAVAHGVFWPRSRVLVPVRWRGSTEAPPRIAITFDDGPDPESTPAILDALEERRAVAAFFVIGRHVLDHPEVLRVLDERGHLIGNHSFSHAYGGMFRSSAYWQGELHRTGDAIAAAIGKRPRLFRPPMGLKNPPMARATRREGCDIITWTRRGRDGIPTTTPAILRRLVAPARAGDVLCLHDGCDPNLRRNPAPTVEAVRPLVDGLRARGLRIVRLDDLLGIPGYQ